MTITPRITPNLWFDNDAEEAARFYVSIFPNSGIDRIQRFAAEGQEIHGRPAGSVMTVEFRLDGQQFLGLNGGPHFKFNEAVSFIVNCATQEEVDYYWDKLGAGGDPNARQCGWLKDRYGLSWQVVPTAMAEMFDDHESAATQRAMGSMLEMKKLDIEALRKAYAGN